MKIISFLGLNAYQVTKYLNPENPNSEFCETKYYQEALAQFYEPDSIYIFLTQKVEKYSPGKFQKLGDNSDHYVRQSEEKSNWEQLKEIFQSKYPHVNLIPVKGIPEQNTVDDIWTIFNKVNECLEEGDEVIFDITHSFRSVPIVALLAVSYFRVVRDVKIKALIYGAFEAKNTNTNETPTFDLLPVIRLFDWLTATDQFLKTGNGRDLASLLRQAVPSEQELRLKPETRPIRSHLEKSAKAIESISLALAITRPIEAMEASSNLRSKLEDAIPTFEKRAKPFTFLVDRVIQEHGQFSLKNSRSQDTFVTNLWLQLKMINWYLDYDQVVQAVTLAREWIISVLVLRFDKPMFQLYGGRNDVELALNNGTEVRKKDPRSIKASPLDDDFEKLPDVVGLTKTWSKTTELRNDIAHVGMNQSKSLSS